MKKGKGISMFVYLVSGTKAFEKCHTTTGYVLKCSFLMLITAILLSVLIIGQIMLGMMNLVDDWPVRLAGIIIFFTAVGFVEELTFRVLVNDAILYQFRNSRYVFVWIAVIGSFVFGAVHVIGPEMFTSPMAFVMAILKTLSSGIAGFCWLILYWKTRNILGIALAHGLFDLFSTDTSLLASKDTQVGGAQAYVSGDATTGGIYVVLIIINIIIARILWKKVGKTIDFEEIRRTW